MLHKAITKNSPSILPIEVYGKTWDMQRHPMKERRVDKSFEIRLRKYWPILPWYEWWWVYVNKNGFPKKLRKSQEEIDNIEKETKDQSSSTLCMEERQKRITASYFGKICKMKSNTRSINTIKELLYKKFKRNNSTEYGKLNEPFVIEDFETKHSVKVMKSGFFIQKTYLLFFS